MPYFNVKVECWILLTVYPQASIQSPAATISSSADNPWPNMYFHLPNIIVAFYPLLNHGSLIQAREVSC